MSEPTFQLRVHLYGVQGSGSVFPSREERRDAERRSRRALLRLVFDDLVKHAGATDSVASSISKLLGGPVSPRTIADYADHLEVPEQRVYGGWTTCIRIETADDHDIVLDCGSGFRNCAHDLQAKWGDRPERHLYLFGSHSHLDHTEGFDQATVCFDPRNHLHVYGNQQFLRALDYGLGIFSREVAPSALGVQSPVHFGVMPAQFQANRIGPAPVEQPNLPSLGTRAVELEKPIRIGETTITAFELYHPAPCLGYRVEHGGKVFVFATDHELRHGDTGDPENGRSFSAEVRLRKHTIGADLLYRDGQYLRAEYDGILGIGGSGAIPRLGWGHSCVEDVVEMAASCNVHHTLIGHHDPNRDWSDRNWLDESITSRTKGTDRRIELASAETVFDL